MNRQEYFDHLLELFEKHIEAKDIRTEYEIQDSILHFIEENPVPEIDGEGEYLGDGIFADNH